MNTPHSDTTAVLISGGVDSAVVVHRLAEQGLPRICSISA